MLVHSAAKVPFTLWGLYALSELGTNSPYLYVALGLAIMGIGSGLFFSPNASAVMSSTPRGYYGVGSGMMTTLRNSGQVVSIALALAVAAAAAAMPQSAVFALFLGTSVNISHSVMASYVNGMDGAFRLSIALDAVAAPASLVRGKEVRRSLEVGLVSKAETALARSVFFSSIVTKGSFLSSRILAFGSIAPDTFNIFRTVTRSSATR